ncbi:hypothetical protein PV10_07848 [Exophiala mesophila]|uniref:Uncharacterized protein n=1 Tax=Exophiala mesophila TaxID=212818 RepID=A0A0D1WNG3_EXOME|nr:uncharacterized protein PV10_07848 [Exophiala mesophila]KIV90560.1 hypothetical protein PV10_07848 [Exophiala mesophila]
MAPVTSKLDIPDLIFSSLELDVHDVKPRDSLTSFSSKRSFVFGDHNPLVPRNDDVSPLLSPIETFNVLTARDIELDPNFNPSEGSVDPTDVNMKGIQALFAIIGAAFVVLIIWFFFWAKNGGFQWRKGDWDDYKSSVLRRKGPNGTTLSNATKSTALGGGSVVGDGYSDKNSRSSYDASTETMTNVDLSSDAPILSEKQGKKYKARKETNKERKIREAREAEWEGGHDNDVRAYRHEKVARVGGLNKDSDGQCFSTEYSGSDRTSNVFSQSYRPNNHPPPPPRHASPEKRQSRRDFSYGQDSTFTATEAARSSRYHPSNKNVSPQRPIRTVPGSFHQQTELDAQSQNTMSYHHPIPGLGGQNKANGYRRNRRDSLDD